MSIIHHILVRDHSPPKFTNYKHMLNLKHMRKPCTLFIFCFVCLNATSQLSKGTWLIGGSGNLNSFNEVYTLPNTASGTAKYTSLEFSASVGYFVQSKLSAGIRTSFSSLKGESSGGGAANWYRLAAGPYVRYYFLDEDKQFNLLGDLSYQVGTNKENGGVPARGKFNTFSAMAGIEVFFNSSVGLEFLIGYRNQITSLENSPSAFNSNRKGLQLAIGLSFHLEK